MHSDNSRYKQLSLQLSSLKTRPTVSLLINQPIYNDYNNIQLQIPTTKRIKHLKTIPSILPDPTLHKMPVHRTISHSSQPQSQKWQYSLQRYICSKQKIVNKLKLSNDFQFLKLNKMNKIKKRKLILQYGVPQDIVKKSKIRQTFQYSRGESQQKYKINKLKLISSNSNIVKTQQQQLPSLYQSTQNKRNNNKISTQQHEHILGHFLQNYYKKKYQGSNLTINKQKVKYNSNKKINAKLNSNRKQLQKYQI